MKMNLADALRCIAHPEGARDATWRRAMEIVYRWLAGRAVQVLRDLQPVDREDVTSELLLRLQDGRRLPELPTDQDAARYLTRALRNAMIDHQRHRKRRRIVDAGSRQQDANGGMDSPDVLSLGTSPNEPEVAAPDERLLEQEDEDAAAAERERKQQQFDQGGNAFMQWCVGNLRADALRNMKMVHDIHRKFLNGGPPIERWVEEQVATGTARNTLQKRVSRYRMQFDDFLASEEAGVLDPDTCEFCRNFLEQLRRHRVLPARTTASTA